MNKKISINISDKSTYLELSDDCTPQDLIIAISVILDRFPPEIRPKILERLSKLNIDVPHLEIIK